MRFHHSTRRGRTNRFGAGHTSGSQLASSGLQHYQPSTSTSRWSQLGYCRETNIIFNRRLPVEPPATTPTPSLSNSTLPISQQRRQRTTTTESLESGVFSDYLPRQSTAANKQDNNILIDSTSSTSPQAQAASGKEGASEEENIIKSLKSMAVDGRKQKQQNLNVVCQSTTPSLSKTCNKRTKFNNNNDDSNKYDLNNNNYDKLDMNLARERLLAKVDKHPFWSNKAARRMELTSCKERNLYIYELTSYCERRELEWRYEPYKGGLVSAIPYKLANAKSITAADQNNNQQQSQPLAPSESLSQSSSRRNSIVQVPTPTQLLNQQTLQQQQALSAAQLKTSDFVWSTTSGSLSRKSSCTQATSLSTSPGKTKNISKTNATDYSPSRKLSPGCLYEPASAIERPVPSAEEVWAIEVPQQYWPELFVGYVYTSEFPHSSFVKRCHGCQGRGRLKCSSCYGVGYEVCISCSGKGTTRSSLAAHYNSSSSSHYNCRNSSSTSRSADHYNRNSTNANYNDDQADSDGSFMFGANRDSRRNYGEPGGITNGTGGGSGLGSWTTESCHNCHGAGQKRCWVCAGKSYNHCSACLGTGKLRCFLQLIVTWINHRDESLLNNSDNIIPKDRLRLCSGLLLADEIGDKLEPLSRQRIDGATGCFEESNQLQLASRKLLEKHRANYHQERLIKQVCYWLLIMIFV